MDLRLLAKQTSFVMVQEIEHLMANFNEPIKHVQVETIDEWVVVYFVLSDTGFVYQFNKRSKEYTESFMALNHMKYFKEQIEGD